jgi:hypothetical protein
MQLRYTPLHRMGLGDVELHLFGDKNPLHPTLLHQGGGENRMLLQRKAHSAIALEYRKRSIDLGSLSATPATNFPFSL